MGAAGPRHRADAGSHLQSPSGMKRTPSCWFKVLPGALLPLRRPETCLFLFIRSLMFPGPQAFTGTVPLSAASTQPGRQALSTPLLQMGKLRPGVRGVTQRHQNNQGQSWGLRLRHHVNAAKCTNIKGTSCVFLHVCVPCIHHRRHRTCLSRQRPLCGRPEPVTLTRGHTSL